MKLLIWILALFLGLSGAVLTLSCGSSPSSPSPNPPTATPTLVTDPSGPILQAQVQSQALTVTGSGPTSVLFKDICQVYAADSTGTTGTANTSVTLVTQGASLGLTFAGLQNTNPPPGTGIQAVTGGLYQNAVTYVPGRDYAFNVDVGGTSYSATITAVDAAATITSGSSGVTCEWSGGGNRSVAEIGPLSGGTYLTEWVDPQSPLAIPASMFTDETPGSGNDLVVLMLVQLNPPGFAGANPSSFVGAVRIYGANY